MRATVSGMTFSFLAHLYISESRSPAQLELPEVSQSRDSDLLLRRPRDPMSQNILPRQHKTCRI
jgi:hypothetical protein